MEITTEEFEQAGKFWSDNIKLYLNAFEDLTKKERERVHAVVMEHPLRDENEPITISSKEEKLINLGIALLNAKMLMLAYVGEQQIKKQNGEENGKETV